MKKLAGKVFLFLTLILITVGCDNQSGITDTTSDKNIGSSKGEVPGSGNINTLPEFFNYSVIGGEEVTLNGSPIWVKESNDPMLNANIHSNENVVINGNKITVQGFVTYVDNITIDGDEINIVPNDNAGKKQAHYQVSGINIPSINVADYKSLADVVYDEDKQLSGTISLGTPEDPYIIYVSGNLYLDNVSFIGYGIILAEEEIEVISDVKSSNLDPNHTKVLLVAGDKFKLNNSNTTLHATVYAKDEINVNAERAYIDGSLASLDKNTLNGNTIDLRFKLVYPGLSQIIFGSNKAK